MIKWQKGYGKMEKDKNGLLNVKQIEKK